MRSEREVILSYIEDIMAKDTKERILDAALAPFIYLITQWLLLSLI